jgi:hypothetical protein
MSNGHDTILIFNEDGKLIEHKSLDYPNTIDGLFSPIRFVNLSQWTKDNNNIVITLSRNGELLIFKGGNLCFAKRRGHWRYFAHDSVIKQFTNNGMGRRSPEKLRREIYLTVLDVSFARTGGCIGIITSSKKQLSLERGLVNETDLLESDSEKLKTITTRLIVGGKKFHELDRLLRLELISIDGATVLDHKGKILASGSILSIQGGSSSGGRQAATDALAEYGLGIKISNDGYVKVINRKKDEIVRLA